MGSASVKHLRATNPPCPSLPFVIRGSLGPKIVEFPRPLLLCIHSASHRVSRRPLAVPLRSALQQIRDFIDKRSSSYASQLKVVYSTGAAPRLRLSGPSGSETVRVDNWKASHIAEFLDERLDRDGAVL